MTSNENTFYGALDIVGGNPQGFPFYTRDLNLDSSVYSNGTHVYYSVSSFSVNSSTTRTITNTDITIEETYGGNPFNVSSSNFTPLSTDGTYSITIKLSVDFPGILPTGITHIAVTSGGVRMLEQSFTPNGNDRSFTLTGSLHLTSTTPIQFLIDNQSTGTVDILDTTKIFLTRLA